MSDIVERLGDVHLDPPYPWHRMHNVNTIIAEAINEIERLRAENERLAAKVSSLTKRLADRYGAETCQKEELLAEVKRLRHDNRVLIECRLGKQSCHECPDTECNDNMREVSDD